MQIKRYSIALTEYKKNVAIIKTLITYSVQRTSYIIVNLNSLNYFIESISIGKIGNFASLKI